MLKLQETLIFLIIFSFWTIRLYYKLYDEKVKKYIMSIGILIIFWMLIRIGKGIVTSSQLERLFWYLYYLPLIFAPTLFYICISNLLNKITKKRKIIIYTISFILLGLILTNDIHELAFKFPKGKEYFDDYNHFIGYYITCIWIFYLFGKGLIKLAINKIKEKNTPKAFLPLILLVLGLLYTYFYIKGLPIFRESNLSVILSTLICLGIELILYLGLISSNSKYKKTFTNSHLDMIVISENIDTIYETKSFYKIPKNIYNDLKNNKAQKTYKEKSTTYNLIHNKDSYILLRNDITKINELKNEIKSKQKELLKIQEKLKNEEQIKKELYQITLRKQIITKLENNMKEKKSEAKEILNKKELTKQDLEYIKVLISYCKRKSYLIISELNNETYNKISINILLKELITDFSFQKITGEVLTNEIKIQSYETSLLYDIAFETLKNIKNTSIIIFITEEKNNIKVKFIIGGTTKIEKPKLPKNIHFIKKNYDTDTELTFKIKKEVTSWD